MGFAIWSGTMIDYDHEANLHTNDAPECVVPHILKKYQVCSVLDIGCGTGVWLNQFSKHGINDIYGIDGVDIGSRDYLSDGDRFRCLNLSKEWELGRKFDLALCLEVAEHLPADSASLLVKTICSHANLVIFSAACPNQHGQGHVNCQWPKYWQELFNNNGFFCEDWLRPILWNEPFPEFWYKQNIFVAERSSEKAGREQRILSHVHPHHFDQWVNTCETQTRLLNGEMGIRTSLEHSINMARKAFTDALHRRVLSKKDLSQ
jgi:hypothetical protein